MSTHILDVSVEQFTFSFPDADNHSSIILGLTQNHCLSRLMEYQSVSQSVRNFSPEQLEVIPSSHRRTWMSRRTIHIEQPSQHVRFRNCCFH